MALGAWPDCGQGYGDLRVRPMGVGGAGGALWTWPVGWGWGLFGGRGHSPWAGLDDQYGGVACRQVCGAYGLLGAGLHDSPRPQLQTWARLEEVRAAIAGLEAEKEEVALAVHALVVSPPPSLWHYGTLCSPLSPHLTHSPPPQTTHAKDTLHAVRPPGRLLWIPPSPTLLGR